MSARGVGDRGLKERRRGRRMSAGKEAVCVRERERGREREVCRKASQAEIVIIVIIHSSVQCHHQQMCLSDHHHAPGFDIMSISGELKRNGGRGGQSIAVVQIGERRAFLQPPVVSVERRQRGN